jgi:hypothetical protein
MLGAAPGGVGAQRSAEQSSHSVAAIPITRVFSHTALNGPGYINMVALSPFSNTLLAAGDVSGVQRSVDLGANYTPGLRGMYTPFSRQTATIAFHPTQPGVVYAGTGEKLAHAGGLYRSADEGQTWTQVSNVPQFAGNNAFGVPGGVSTNIPRATGKLLGIYANPGGHDTIFAGTFNQGLMRSTDSGITWTTLGFSGKYIRGLEFDPTSPGNVYIAVFHSGVWVSHNALAATGVKFALMPGSPLDPEELSMTGNEIFAVANAKGIYRYNGTSWSAVNSGVPLAASVLWMSVKAYRKNALTIVYAGNNGAPKDATTGGRISVVRSVDNGNSWQSVTSTAAAIDYHMVGTTAIWAQSVTSPSSMLGNGFYAAQHLDVKVSPTGDWSNDTVFVSGRGGVWRSTNGARNWAPAVNGLQTSVNRAINVDPNVSGRVFVGNTDFVAYVSNDRMASITNVHPSGAVSTARDFAFDTTVTPSTVFLAAGDRDLNVGGEVFFSTDPASAAWTRTNLNAAAGGRRPLALALGFDVDRNRIVLAAVDTAGIFRYAGGRWTKVSTPAMSIAGTNIAASAVSPNAQMIWIKNTQTVFLFDAAQGVWRSTDAGLSWTLIWRHPSVPAEATYLAAEPDLSSLYVAADDGLYRLDNPAQGTVTGGAITHVRIGSSRPGPIFLDVTNQLWVAQLYTSTTMPQLLVTADPKSAAPTWQVASDAYYSAVAVLPTGLVVAPDGTVYLSLYHDGVLRGV